MCCLPTGDLIRFYFVPIPGGMVASCDDLMHSPPDRAVQV